MSRYRKQDWKARKLLRANMHSPGWSYQPLGLWKGPMARASHLLDTPSGCQWIWAPKKSPEIEHKESADYFREADLRDIHERIFQQFVGNQLVSLKTLKMNEFIIGSQESMQDCPKQFTNLELKFGIEMATWLAALLLLVLLVEVPLSKYVLLKSLFDKVELSSEPNLTGSGSNTVPLKFMSTQLYPCNFRRDPTWK